MYCSPLVRGPASQGPYDYGPAIDKWIMAHTRGDSAMTALDATSITAEPFTTPSRLERLLASVDALRLRQPIFVKMPSDLRWKECNELLRVIARHHIDGVTIGNLTKDRSRVELKDVLPDHVKSGLSGKPRKIQQTRLFTKHALPMGTGS